MIFLSAQPATKYFLWQLEIQLANFLKMGITRDQIHILLAPDKKYALDKEDTEIITRLESKCGNVHFYNDTRLGRNYPSSIRPNIIKQHFSRYPELKDEWIFFHDSDIVFRELPDFNRIMNDNVWSVSDTSSYTGYNYISEKMGELGFIKMCEAVGLPPDKVKVIPGGGSQYFFKGTDSDFWNKVENDSEKLFQTISKLNIKLKKKIKIKSFKSDVRHFFLQEWCSDIWAITWNSLILNSEIKIEDDLDFCWPMNLISSWEKKKILHYSGVGNEYDVSIFNKLLYTTCSPYYDNFSRIDKKLCSSIYVNEILNFRKSIEKDRKDLTDVTFIIPVRIDSTDRTKNLEIVTRYLDKNFITNIFIIEADDIQKVNTTLLPNGIYYEFYNDQNLLFHRNKYLNIAIKKCSSKFISIYDTDTLVPVNQMIESIEQLRSLKSDLSLPYDGCVKRVSRNSLDFLSRSLNLNYLEILDENSFMERACGGIVNLNRNSFIECGLNNEKFKSWGPDDIERVKRMEILGYKLSRTTGSLFHLEHFRGINSMPISWQQVMADDAEFLNICQMTRLELINYVTTWEWVK